MIPSSVLRPGTQFLGVFTLRAAAAADVHVVRGSSETAVAQATVRAIGRELGSARAVVVREAVTDDGGWAHLTGLPPYRDLRVVAESREGDLSEPAAIHIEPGGRGVIDPLKVREPSALVVDAKIDDSVLARFPDARLVSLLIRPADPYRQAEQQQKDNPTAAGPVRFERLRPGRWIVRGFVKVAGTYSPAEIEDVELKAGETRQVKATISPSVFDGIVTSGGRGIAANVILDDRGQRIYFHSDGSGVFRAALEKKGTYDVAVARLSDQGNIIPIGEVAFTDPSRRIEITIPAGATVIAHVWRDHQPVSHSAVWISRRDESGAIQVMTNRARTTDSGGQASFDDLAPGVWTFSVRDDKGSGAEKTITVEKGTNTVVDLDLGTGTSIRGTVHDLGASPLPAAHVECLYVGPSGNPDSASANSDGDGHFEISLVPPPPQSALCSVVAPMGTVDAFRAVPGQPADLTVPAATAALRIDDWGEQQAPNLYWAVTPDGRAIDLTTVAAMIGAYGRALTIPALAVGPWKIVRIESLPQWLSLAAGLGNSLPAIASVTLSAGATETIHLGGAMAREGGRSR